MRRELTKTHSPFLLDCGWVLISALRSFPTSWVSRPHHQCLPMTSGSQETLVTDELFPILSQLQFRVSWASKQDLHGNPDQVSRRIAAVVCYHCLIIVAVVIVVGIGALFLLFVLLYSQRVASHSCETLQELLHDPRPVNTESNCGATLFSICLLELFFHEGSDKVVRGSRWDTGEMLCCQLLPTDIEFMFFMLSFVNISLRICSYSNR